jgi:hypothetical protein
MKAVELQNEGDVFIDKDLQQGVIKDAHIGIQVAPDGRMWICINGESAIRFTSHKVTKKYRTNEV